jgi:hypothetical integral membrane protein (TIGR02206 family)
MGQIILIILLLILGFSTVYFKEFIQTHHRKIEIALAIILLLSRIGRNTEYFIDGDYHKAFPLQLCTISTYLAMLYYFFKWKKLRVFLFFYGFLGLTAFIDPDIPVWSEALKGFYLYGFTIDHLIITVSPLFLVLYDDFEFDINDAIAPTITAVILIFIAWPMNILWDGANFFYLVEKPVVSDVFGENVSNLFYIFWFFVAYVIINAINLLIIKLITKSNTYLSYHK